MTNVTRLTFAVLCVGVLASALLAQQSSFDKAASLPRMIRFGGVLKDAAGKPAQGTIGVTFAFYKDEQGGAPLWMETQNLTVDSSGHYSVMLGSTKNDGLPVELFISNEARWLGVEPQGLPEPARVLLLSVPYALKAGDAETIGGLPPSAFVLAADSNTRSSLSSVAIALANDTLSPSTQSSVTTSGGNVTAVPLWSTATDIENSVISQTGSGITGRVGINTATPTTTLDINGSTTIRGTLALPPTGLATATAGASSQPANLTASSFSSGSNTAVSQTFRFQAKPTGNNTSSPSATLDLLYGAGTAAPAETGLKIAHNGLITFTAGQTFPGTGSGTITGVTAGTDLTGGGNHGTVTLNVDTTKVVTGVKAGVGLTGGGTGGVQTLSLDTTKIPLLMAANSFTGNQAVTGNVTASGTVSGSVVNATNFTLRGSLTPFASGSIQNNNAFLGFAGNSATSGIGNVATGPQALLSDTTGSYNTANGQNALDKNTAGSNNIAAGASALSSNTTGGYNTAVGNLALVANITGSYNVGVGYGAGPDVNSPALTNATAIGAFARVSKSNALVLGGTGAQAVNVGIGTATPSATLDVHGTANFAGPIAFAPGQTFPGTGTITGVTAGTGLNGGGTTGTVALSLNTGFSDGRYAQLAAKNTFTAVQIMNSSVGIGVSAPAFPLHVMGAIRSETGGISVGGSAPVQIDAPFIPGGRLTILSNGKVGINNPNPTTNLDVGGSIVARGALIGQSLSVNGGGVINGGITTDAGITTGAGVVVGGALSVGSYLKIGNDPAMNAAPHMYLTGYVSASESNGSFPIFAIPSKDILITRLTVGSGNPCPQDGSQYVSIETGDYTSLKDLYDLNLALGTSNDSGPLSIPIPAGSHLWVHLSPVPSCSGSWITLPWPISVEYVMQ